MFQTRNTLRSNNDDLGVIGALQRWKGATRGAVILLHNAPLPAHVICISLAQSREALETVYWETLGLSCYTVILALCLCSWELGSWISQSCKERGATMQGFV